MTVRLYLDNSYCKKFTATVKKVKRENDLWAVILDKTAFFPTSGGQPHDTGWLDGKEVIDVFEDGEEVVHLIKEEIKEKTEVEGEINWKRRFDHMQQHTAQHLLSAVLLELYRLQTVGFHLGSEVTTIDLPLPNLEERALIKAEEMTNELITRNLGIRAYFMPREKISELNLRKKEEIPKGTFLRVVEIEGVDRSLCCGTHLAHTGEIGMIKIIQKEKVKGNTRIGFLAGFRALREYQREHQLLKELSSELNFSFDELKKAIENLKLKGKRLKRENKELRNKLADLLAERMISEGEEEGDILVYSGILKGIDRETLRLSVIKGANKRKAVLLVGGITGEEVHLIFASSKGLGLPMHEAMEKVVPLIKGKGGGSKEFASGEGNDPSRLEEALLLARKTLRIG
ncbi:MAG: alanyl-tRNA editing protein AlaX-L [Acidobacteria bacterium]|nr:alanyl-tRNA editing protein AlaX-L [Acidobacteriota bacterium]